MPKPPRTAPPTRPIGRRELAFVRAWAEGLDAAEAWHRFMAGTTGTGAGTADARRARGELRRLREQLGTLARSLGRPDIAALLRRDPEAMAEPATAVPTLDAFRARQPPDFYSEAELVALYEAEHGRLDSRSAARRRQRLRERLVRALQWLDAQVLREPRPGDAVSGWLDERVAARLATAGIHRLDELHRRAATGGPGWHRAIPRLGPAGAQRIVAWLAGHPATLGPLPATAGLPRRGLDIRALTPPPAVAVAPIERLLLPAGLDGSQGRHRAPAARCRIAAGDDRQAVLAWLALRPEGSHTWRSYRKEAERLLLWAVLRRGRALSSLDARDLAAYRAFMQAPGPDWTAPRHVQRWSADWRPFEGPLSAASADLAMAVLRALFAWLTRQHYLEDTPFERLPGEHAGRAPRQGPGDIASAAAGNVWGARAGPAPQPGRSPGPMPAPGGAAWGPFRAWLSNRPGLAGARLRAIIEMLHGTGLRMAELAAARMDWLARLDDGASGEGGEGAHDPQSTGGLRSAHEALHEGAQAAVHEVADEASNMVPPDDRWPALWVLHVHGRPDGQLHGPAHSASDEAPKQPAGTGRRHGARSVTLPADAARALGTYLSWREWPGDLSAMDPQAPLIARLDRAAPLSAARLGGVVARALADGANAIEAADPQAAAQLRATGAVALRRWAASPHTARA